MTFLYSRLFKVFCFIGLQVCVANAQEKPPEANAISESLNAPENDKFAATMILSDFGAFNITAGGFSPAYKNMFRIGLLAGITEFLVKNSEGRFSKVQLPDYRIQFRIQGRLTDFVLSCSTVDFGVQKFKDGRSVGYFEIGKEIGINSADGFSTLGLAWRSHFIGDSRQLDDSGALLRRNMLVPRLVFGRYF